MKRLGLAFVIFLATGPAWAQSASMINPSSRSFTSRDMDRIPTPYYRTPTRDIVRDPNTGRPLAIIEGPSGIVGNEYTIRDPNTGRPRAKISP
jgi:hypothetical protein